MRRADREHTQNHDIQPVQRPYADTAPPTQPTLQLKKKSRKSFAVIACLVAVLVIGGLGGWFYTHKDKNPLPENIRKSVSFPLYYPSPLPKGYSLDKDSVKSSGGIVFYDLKSGSGDTIGTSMQSVPSKFNATATLKSAIKSTSNVPVGVAYNVGTDQKHIIIINTTDNVLVFLNSSRVGEAQLQVLAANLKPIK